jgi:hypothetical protein
MNIQAKVGLDKQRNPDRFCPVHRCLWRVKKLNHATQTHYPDPRYPTGYCPRHAHLAPQRSAA